MYRSTEWLQNNVLLNDSKIIFFDEQKHKDGEAAAYFHIKAAKIAQVIIILRKFVLENLISVMSFLLEIHSIFICSITGFRAIHYPSPVCASTPLS